MGRRRKVTPIDSLSSPRFAGISTFARLPHTRNLDQIDAAFIGVPFDDGTTFRPGSRFGPKAVREASLLLRPYNPALKVNTFDVLNVVDYGDVEVVPGYIEDTYGKIESAIMGVNGSGVIPVVCGGDHSITLPILRALAKLHGRLSLIHVDAHFDCLNEYFGRRYNHGTVFRRALEEGLVDPGSSIHVGVRGSAYSAEDYEGVSRMGFEFLTADEIVQTGIPEAIRRITGTVRGKVYLSFDVDACDPSVAPGTGTPEVGGFTANEALRLVRGLVGTNCVGFDVVEVSPPYDVANITSLLAANLTFEFLSVLAYRRSVNAL